MKESNISKIEKIILLIYNILILFAKQIPSLVVLLGGILFIGYIMFRFKKVFKIQERLLVLLCLLAPTSFVSILGTGYGELPITWFHIVTCILIITIVVKPFKINMFFILPIIFIAFSLITLFRVSNIIDALKQIMTITIFLFSFFIADQFKNVSSELVEKKLSEYYITNIDIFIVIVMLQKILISQFNILVGHSVAYTGRKIYAGYMTDYSFATLYIATGALLLVVRFFDKKEEVSWKNFIIRETLYLVGMLTVNSRTGLFAFILTAGIFVVIKMIKGNLKSFIIVLLAIVILPMIFEQVSLLRGGQALLDDSGRTSGYINALEIFMDNPLIGCGFGLGNLRAVYGIGVPHNLVIQYLAQMGIIGLGIFSSLFIIMFIKYNAYLNIYIWIIIEIFIGAMAIPDIVSSRFLSIIIIMFILKANRNKLEK